MKQLMIVFSFLLLFSPIKSFGQEGDLNNKLDEKTLKDYKFVQHDMAFILNKIDYYSIESYSSSLSNICYMYSKNTSKEKFPNWSKIAFADFCEYADKLALSLIKMPPDKSINYCKPLKSLKQNFEKGRNSDLWLQDIKHDEMFEGINKALNYKKTDTNGMGWYGPKTITIYSCK